MNHNHLRPPQPSQPDRIPTFEFTGTRTLKVGHAEPVDPTVRLIAAMERLASAIERLEQVMSRV